MYSYDLIFMSFTKLKINNIYKKNRSQLYHQIFTHLILQFALNYNNKIKQDIY